MLRHRLTSFFLCLLLISACDQVGSPTEVEGPTIVRFGASELDASGDATLVLAGRGRDLFVYRPRRRRRNGEEQRKRLARADDDLPPHRDEQRGQ